MDHLWLRRLNFSGFPLLEGSFSQVVQQLFGFYGSSSPSTWRSAVPPMSYRSHPTWRSDYVFKPRYNDPFLHIKLVSTFRPKFNASMYESCWLNKVERAPELDLELGGCSTSSKDGQSAPIGWYTVVGPSEDTSKRTTNITHQKAKRCPALNPFGRQSRVRSLFWPPSANQRAHDSVPKRQSWQLRRRQRPPLIAPRQANEEDTDPTMLFNLVILLHILANTNTS